MACRNPSTSLIVLEFCIPLMYVDKNEMIEYSYIPTLLHMATLTKYKLKTSVFLTIPGP